MMSIFICHPFNICKQYLECQIIGNFIIISQLETMPPKTKTIPALQNSDLQEELLAIKLLYCVRKRPQNEQKRVIQSIKQTLEIALFRVVSTVEKVLSEKGYFKGSVTLLQDYHIVINFMVQRTDILLINQFLHQFYEKGLPSIQSNKLIEFYNCLVENMQKRKKQKMEIQCFSLDEDSSEEQKQPKQQQKIHEINNNQNVSNMAQKSEDQIVQVAELPQRELSEESKAFIESFTAGYKPVQRGKHKIVKRIRMACLKYGEPLYNWQYYDSLEGGVVKLTFTSLKQE